MSRPQVHTRKRDKFWPKWGRGRSDSPNIQPITHAGVSNTPSVDSLPSTVNQGTRGAASTLSTSSCTPTTPVVGLWLDALGKLKEEDRQVIQMILPTMATQGPLSERIDELVGKIKAKQNECKEKSYKFHFQGKEIILRDVAEKTVFWLNKFKDVGDIAVSFDPVHSALPWAGVRFLLQMVVGEQDQMGALLVSVEKVTYLTNRCTIYENLYKPETTSGDALDNLHASLVELYTAILQLVALTYRLFTKSTAGRAGYAIVNPDEVSKYIDKCQSLETRVEIEANNCERICNQREDAEFRRLLESLQTPVLRTDERVSSLLEMMDDRDRLEILDWTSKILYGKHHDTVKDKRTKDTCEWLLGHNCYQEWKDTSSSVALWLCGTAGTGKTNLTSKVIDEIHDALKSNPNDEGFAFFYCNRNERERQEALSVLRSFVRQLSTIVNNEHSMQKHLRASFIQKRANASVLTMNDCKELLLQFINLYPKTTLILDALDECDTNERSALMEIFDHFLTSASNPVKVFISSRPDGDITEKLKNRANIQIQATDNHGDISKFIESEITRHPRWRKMSTTLQTDIVDTLEKGSQGMFQWAYLQIKDLLCLTLEKDIRDRLGKLPQGLKAAYAEVYDQIKARSERERQIIAPSSGLCVLASRLSSEELLPAVCQEEYDDIITPIGDLDEDLLLDYCHNLLVIDPNRQVWTPSHLSVIEYFETLWTETQVDCLVASVCLLLLNNTSQQDAEKYPSEEGIVQVDSFNSLGYYARHHWVIHVQKCEKGKKGLGNERLSSLLKRFLGSQTNSSPAYQSWHRMILKDDYRKPSSSIFYNSRISPNVLEPDTLPSLAIYAFGFYTILSDWWDKPWTEFARRNKRGHSPLQLAAISGSVTICGRLIEWGADVNEQLQDEDYGSALTAAASTGNEEIIELLISSGADVNAQLQAGDYGSALAAAAWGGNKEIVKLLISSGADVNAQLQVGDYGNALAAAAAAYGGNKEIVELLISSGADVNAQLQGGRYGSALAAAAAAYGGNKEIVELLISSGADVNAQLQVGYYGNALAAAAAYGRNKIIELLISSGADVNAQLQVGNYGSALAAAAWGGNKEIVELLISSGADVNAQLQVGYYGNALLAAAAAAYEGNKEIVELLISSGADVNAQLQVGDYGSALAAAAWGGNKEIVELLISSGADVNAQLQVGNYGNALAAARENKEIVELLTSSGADANALH